MVRGIETVAQMTMDVGVKRNLSDWARMSGYSDPYILASIATKLQKADECGLESAFSKGSPDEVTLMSSADFIEKNYRTRIEPLRRLVRPLMDVYRNVSSGTWAVLLEQFKNNVSIDDFYDFYGQLVGKQVPCKSVMLLIAKLQANSRQSSQGKLPQKTIAALTIKAFNAYMRGDDIKVLSYKQGGSIKARDSFPVVYKSEVW